MFGSKKIRNAAAKAIKANAHTAVKELAPAPKYTIDRICDYEMVERALMILNCKVTPSIQDWEEIHWETCRIWNRLVQIKRDSEDEEVQKMAWATWLTDRAQKAACTYHLLVMAFRKAWYLNRFDEAVKDSRNDLVYIGDDSTFIFGYSYDRHHAEFGYPDISAIGYLDLRNGLKPFTDWAI